MSDQLILTAQGWRPIGLMDKTHYAGWLVEQLERDERIRDWRGVTDREQDDQRGVLRK